MQARGKVFQKMVYDVIWLDNDWGLKEGRKYSIFPLSVIRTYVFVVFFSSWMVKTVIHHWLWPLATLRSSSTEKWPQSWLAWSQFFWKMTILVVAFWGTPCVTDREGINPSVRHLSSGAFLYIYTDFYIKLINIHFNCKNFQNTLSHSENPPSPFLYIHVYSSKVFF